MKKERLERRLLELLEALQGDSELFSSGFYAKKMKIDRKVYGRAAKRCGRDVKQRRAVQSVGSFEEKIDQEMCGRIR